jgi:hypothetical protein
VDDVVVKIRNSNTLIVDLQETFASLREYRWKLNPMLTVYFGTPSMFIALWFGFDYGTNPPLGTLII